MLSRLSQSIEPFHVMEIVKQADQLQQQGRDVIHLSIGEPDFPLPEPVAQALTQAIGAGKTRYTAALGLQELRETIAHFYDSRFGATVSPGQVVITSGASTGLMYACLALINPGDEVLLCDPGYPCNKTFVQTAGGVARTIQVSEGNNFQPTLAEVQAAWTPKTWGVFLASPSNPTGTRISSNVLNDIVDWVATQGGFIIMDEIYQLLCYGSQPRTLLSQSPSGQTRDHCVVINSFSKYFGMTGLRLGWMVVPEALVTPIEKLAQNLNICPSTPAQWAALACFKQETLDICEARRAAFGNRREFLLRELPNVGLHAGANPDGAFYVYAHAPYGSSQYCSDLLQAQAVCTVPGKDFSQKEGEAMFRISYANSLERIEQALQRMGQFNCREI